MQPAERQTWVSTNFPDNGTRARREMKAKLDAVEVQSDAHSSPLCVCILHCALRLHLAPSCCCCTPARMFCQCICLRFTMAVHLKRWHVLCDYCNVWAGMQRAYAKCDSAWETARNRIPGLRAQVEASRRKSLQLGQQARKCFKVAARSHAAENQLLLLSAHSFCLHSASHPSVHSSMRSFLPAFIHSFTHSSIHSFTTQIFS